MRSVDLGGSSGFREFIKLNGIEDHRIEIPDEEKRKVLEELSIQRTDNGSLRLLDLDTANRRGVNISNFYRVNHTKGFLLEINKVFDEYERLLNKNGGDELKETLALKIYALLEKDLKHRLSFLSKKFELTDSSEEDKDRYAASLATQIIEKQHSVPTLVKTLVENKVRFDPRESLELIIQNILKNDLIFFHDKTREDTFHALREVVLRFDKYAHSKNEDYNFFYQSCLNLEPTQREKFYESKNLAELKLSGDREEDLKTLLSYIKPRPINQLIYNYPGEIDFQTNNDAVSTIFNFIKNSKISSKNKIHIEANENDIRPYYKFLNHILTEDNLEPLNLMSRTWEYPLLYEFEKHLPALIWIVLYDPLYAANFKEKLLITLDNVHSWAVN